MVVQADETFSHAPSSRAIGTPARGGMPPARLAGEPAEAKAHSVTGGSGRLPPGEGLELLGEARSLPKVRRESVGGDLDGRGGLPGAGAARALRGTEPEVCAAQGGGHRFGDGLLHTVTHERLELGGPGGSGGRHPLASPRGVCDSVLGRKGAPGVGHRIQGPWELPSPALFLPSAQPLHRCGETQCQKPPAGREPTEQVGRGDFQGSTDSQAGLAPWRRQPWSRRVNGAGLTSPSSGGGAGVPGGPVAVSVVPTTLVWHRKETGTQGRRSITM